MEGLLGRKIGMTQVFDDQGRRIAVTVLEAGPCPVVQVKTPDTDGYRAAQLGFGEQKPSRLSKAQVKHFEKAGVKPCRLTREFALDDGEEVKPGEAVTVAMFDGVKYVDVSGVTKGRGFAGVIRRYRIGGGPHTHGGHFETPDRVDRRAGSARLGGEGQAHARSDGQCEPQGAEPDGGSGAR